MSALIWSPFGNEEQARETAATLLDERLVVCANLVGNVPSLFLWRGALEEAQECGVLFKTDASLLAKAVRRLEELHPYETPVVFGWECQETGAATRGWLDELTPDEPSGAVDGDTDSQATDPQA